MRLPLPKLHLSLAGLLVSGASHLAWAVEEIGEPAGDLPESAELPEVAPTEDAVMADPEPDPNAADVGSKPKKGETETEKPAENWDSYADPGTGGVAQEITKGVRVEDIVEPPSDYRYAAFGRADPFVPPMVTSDKPVGPGNLEIPIVSPLQRFDVSELEVVGVWQLATGERKAMILTPSRDESGGQGIIVKNGDPIGKRGGKILGIGDDFLTVREFMLAADGTRQYEDQQMYMGKRSPDEQPGKIIFKPGEAQTEVRIESLGPMSNDASQSEPGASRLAPPARGGPASIKKPGVGNGDMGGAAQTKASAPSAGPSATPSAPSTAYKSLQPAPAAPSQFTPTSAAPAAVTTPPSTIQGNQQATPASTVQGKY